MADRDASAACSTDGTKPPVPWRSVGRVLCLVVAVLVVAAGLLTWLDAIGGPEGLWQRFGVLAPLISALLIAGLSVTLFPTDFLCIANGTLYGFWLGALVSWIGWWAGSLLEYLAGVRLRQQVDVDALLAKLPERLQRIPADHPLFIIGCRVVPYAGGHVASFVPGVVGAPFVRMLWCSALGTLPGAFITAAIGQGGAALISTWL